MKGWVCIDQTFKITRAYKLPPKHTELEKAIQGGMQGMYTFILFERTNKLVLEKTWSNGKNLVKKYVQASRKSTRDCRCTYDDNILIQVGSLPAVRQQAKTSRKAY